jgi:hypothetical protein
MESDTICFHRLPSIPPHALTFTDAYNMFRADTDAYFASKG